MDFFKDRRALALGGIALALVAGLLVAAVIMARRGAPDQAPAASQGGLVVQTGRDDDIKLDPRRPLRCFVNGQLIGELPLSACAQKNGVATGALDVGLDPSGALAASNGPSSAITPLPPSPENAPLVATTDAAPAAAASPQAAVRPAAGLGACWAYGDAQWSRLPGDATLSACVQSLYAGRCVRPGAAAYGRWADRTLRLMPGRVEISPDNRNFRLLVEQGPTCSIPYLG